MQVSEDIQGEILGADKNTIQEKPKEVRAYICSPDCIAAVKRNGEYSRNLANKVKDTLMINES